MLCDFIVIENELALYNKSYNFLKEFSISLRHVSERVQSSERGTSRTFHFPGENFGPKFLHMLRRNVLHTIKETGGPVMVWFVIGYFLFAKFLPQRS